MSLTRRVCPDSSFSSTTAVALSIANGLRLGLQRGANVLMVNLSPLKYRSLYEIYPAKAGITESPHAQLDRVASLLFDLGRRARRRTRNLAEFRSSPADGRFIITRCIMSGLPKMDLTRDAVDFINDDYLAKLLNGPQPEPGLVRDIIAKSLGNRR